MIYSALESSGVKVDYKTAFLFFFLFFKKYMCCPVGFIVPFTEHWQSRCNIILFLKKINLFNYFWLHWVFVAARGLSLVAASGGYSSLRCAGFLLLWLLLLRSTGSRRAGFSSCSMQAQ